MTQNCLECQRLYEQKSKELSTLFCSDRCMQKWYREIEQVL